MGSLCSKSNSHSGGHQVLGSSAPEQPSGSRPSPNSAALAAAEARSKAAQARGTHANNPNRGKLAAKLEASKSAKQTAAPKEEERLVWD
ncbi:hypothetical protein FIBSPDRAFT_849823 [Athelia psychrophila]|uniref:Uncharacterized protein n=1 Tax=Athelia psychrophila TaxID=1759441 RepID=A0A166U5A3_9AGAM|nr:hypothetical protein FIBSPDRAFT_849823 [Fibularhizoctonia sp. CBS 109695]